MLTRGREAQARASPDTVLSPLPSCFVRAVFLLLPADQRLRCVEVSRAWRALLSDTSFWTSLDVSDTCGLIRFSEALFRAVIAKAGGQLRVLNVSGRGIEVLPTRTLLHALTSNATNLELLYARRTTLYTSAEVVKIGKAAPLAFCHVCLQAVTNVEQARRYLRNEPPYGRLRLHSLIVHGEGQLNSLESLEALCSDLIMHSTLANIVIHGASHGTAAAMYIVVNAAIALRLKATGLLGCGCTRTCVPELTRLVCAGTLEEMYIFNGDVELFEDGADTDRFCAAVRASASITHL